MDFRQFLTITSFTFYSVILCSQPIVGIYGSFSGSTYTGDKPDTIAVTLGGGFLAGVTVDFNINDAVSLSFQPGFQQETGNVSVLEMKWRDIYTVRSTFITFPLFVKIYSLKKKLYFLTGLEPSYRLDIELREKDTEQKISFNDSSRDFNLSADFGLGYRFRLKPSHLNLEFRYSQGIINMIDSEDANSTFQRVKLVATRLVLTWEIPILGGRQVP